MFSFSWYKYVCTLCLKLGVFMCNLILALTWFSIDSFVFLFASVSSYLNVVRMFYMFVVAVCQEMTHE